MADIVLRLRQAAKFGGHYKEAADVIERLRENLRDCIAARAEMERDNE